MESLWSAQAKAAARTSLKNKTKTKGMGAWLKW
jgi:hypothetical protein